MFGDETTRTVEEGDYFEMGDFLITILGISGDMTDEPTYECAVTDRQAEIEIRSETVVETIDEETNETEEGEE